MVSDSKNVTSEGRTYLITGASGFIGHALCKRLLESGAIVCGASRREFELESPNWAHKSIDLTNAEDVERLLSSVRPDFVLHLASCVTGKREIEWIQRTLNGNLVSAVNVLVASQNCGVEKVVLAGSLEEPDRGDTQPVAASPYAASKWCASTYARMMHALYGTSTAIARIFMVFGPGQQDLTKLVPYVCTSAARGIAPELMSGGRPVDWIFIDDVVEGLIRLAHRGPDDGSYVDLGSGILTTTGTVAEKICAIAGDSISPIFGAVPERAMEQVRKAHLDETRKQLSWSPRIDLDSGLRQTFSWYRELALSADSS
jgi:nucleoside-diphosphate-sugar epimerase